MKRLALWPVLGHRANNAFVTSICAVCPECGQRCLLGGIAAFPGAAGWVSCISMRVRHGAHAMAAAQRLRARLHASVLPVRGQCLAATMSLGPTQWHANEPLAQALERADGLLYQAKAAGRDCVISDIEEPAGVPCRRGASLAVIPNGCGRGCGKAPVQCAGAASRKALHGMPKKSSEGRCRGQWPGVFSFHDDSSTAFRWTTPKPDTAGLSIT